MDFRLPVKSGSIRNGAVELVVLENVVGVSRWNGVAIWSRSGDMSTSGLAAAIFDFRLPVTSGSIRNNAIELLDPENVG